MGVKFIGFNPMGGESYSYVSEKMDKSDYDRLLAVNLIKAFQRAAKNGIYEARIGRKAIEFVRNGFIFTDCGAVNSQLIIQPDGKIGYCHASRKYDVGSVFNQEFSVYDKGEIKAWREALPINRKGCLTCPAISICGYGCFHHVLEDRGDVSFRDTQTCSYTKKLMQLLIWELYKNTKEMP
jgi:radical SAM protein with 4Fe4S-binding SPASM domain